MKKCVYCAFFSVCGAKHGLIDSYFSALESQIGLIPSQKLQTVYFGGGTPTFASSEKCARLLDFIAAHHEIDKNAEITIEANPKTVSETDLKTLKSSGFNRLSLGLQSADDNVLINLGRSHSVYDFEVAYGLAFDAGFDNISVDIMFGLPRDFGIGFTKTLDFVTALSPKHISAYSLSVEKGTLLCKNQKNHRFPTEDEEEAEYDELCAALCGYEHYEISSFAKSGYKSRHNSAYWDLTPYIGMGASAHSFFENKRFSYPESIDGFIKSSNVLFGNSDYAFAKEESDAELSEERIMLGLRTSLGARLNASQMKKAASAIKAGLAVSDGDRLVLNSKGYRVSNEIIAQILA